MGGAEQRTGAQQPGLQQVGLAVGRAVGRAGGIVRPSYSTPAGDWEKAGRCPRASWSVLWAGLSTCEVGDRGGSLGP